MQDQRCAREEDGDWAYVQDDGGWAYVHAMALEKRLWKSGMPCRCGCHHQHHRQHQQQHLLLLSAGMHQEMNACL